MSIFDKLKNNTTLNEEKKNTSINKESRMETFSFNALPESLEEMKRLKEATLDSPFKTAALTILALCAFAADRNIGVEMLNFLRGPRPLSAHDISFLKDRMMDGKTYIPFSYFEGATPENDYTPAKPFTLKISSTSISFQDEGYAKLFVSTKGADSPRYIQLRMKGDGTWCLWEQFILVGIREPKSSNPWA